MGRVIAGMTLSLDGYGADAAGAIDPLYADFAELRQSPAMASAIAETGAVVMGRRAFAMADPDDYAGSYEFQVPIFVLTSHPPARRPKQDDRLTFTFVGDGIVAAVARARAAAGSRDVQIVGGASVIRQALRAGLVDKLHLDLVPVLLGSDLRLLEDLEPDRVRFETIGAETTPRRTSLRFRVLR